MPKYRKKPLEVEAIQWTGDNLSDIVEFAGDKVQWFKLSESDGIRLSIDTLEGSVIVSKDDFIIRGVVNELYICKPFVFEKTYEPV